jgi:hypothetical protein
MQFSECRQPFIVKRQMPKTVVSVSLHRLWYGYFVLLVCNKRPDISGFLYPTLEGGNLHDHPIKMYGCQKKEFHMNFSKKIWIITLMVAVGFSMVGLTSCGETGGTIVVKNEYTHPNQSFYICITDTSNKLVTGVVLINYQQTHEFVVKDDGSYWVCSQGSGVTLYPIEKVSVSGGETVRVTFPK